MTEQKQVYQAKIDFLFKALKGHPKALILMHDNPDPDAIASALSLKYILNKKFGVTSLLVYSGLIGRAENQAMVRLLKIKLTPITKVNLRRYKSVILVDAQPGFGNNSLPAEVEAAVVIDHHPLSRRIKADFVDVRPDYGATATILTEYILASGLDLKPDLATALCYAINSETQSLGREASQADVEAYLKLFPKSNKRLLSKIEHPKYPRQYFSILVKAIRGAFIYRNIIGAKLGVIDNPDFVPQIADMLLSHERISWFICTGRWNNLMLISLRTNNIKAEAGKILRQIAGNNAMAGGHDMMAGGRVDCGQMSPEQYQQFENNIIKKILRILGHKEASGMKPVFTEDIPVWD